MGTPKPLSEDWLFWNPETIHRYPQALDEPVRADRADKLAPARTAIDHRLLARGLLRDLLAGFVSGLVAAVLLAAVIAFFPSIARADAVVAPMGHTSPASGNPGNGSSIGRAVGFDPRASRRSRG